MQGALVCKQPNKRAADSVVGRAGKAQLCGQRRATERAPQTSHHSRAITHHQPPPLRRSEKFSQEKTRRPRGATAKTTTSGARSRSGSHSLGGMSARCSPPTRAILSGDSVFAQWSARRATIFTQQPSALRSPPAPCHDSGGRGGHRAPERQPPRPLRSDSAPSLPLLLRAQG